MEETADGRGCWWKNLLQAVPHHQSLLASAAAARFGVGAGGASAAWQPGRCPRCHCLRTSAIYHEVMCKCSAQRAGRALLPDCVSLIVTVTVHPWIMV